MNKNFTKSHKNQKSNVKKSKEKILEWSKIVKKAVEVKNANAEVVTKNEITTTVQNKLFD